MYRDEIGNIVFVLFVFVMIMWFLNLEKEDKRVVFGCFLYEVIVLVCCCN